MIIFPLKLWRCDRCDAEAQSDDRPAGWVTWDGLPHIDHLCGICYRSLKNWLDDGKKAGHEELGL